MVCPYFSKIAVSPCPCPCNIGKQWQALQAIFRCWDIKSKFHGSHFVDISCVRRGGNKVAHILAQYAIIIENELYWMEDSPPPVIEALYQDCLNMNE